MIQRLPRPEAAALVALSGALATRDEGVIRSTMTSASEICGMESIEEALLQAHLFLGYPSALTAFRLWREVSGRPAPTPLEEDAEIWPARGEAVCRQVYGDAYEGLLENVGALHPELGAWMVVEGYGKVLGRPGLPLPDRELCIVGMLAVLDRPTQLHSHLRGALATGVAPEEVEAALSAVEPFCETMGARDRAWACWQGVVGRWRGRGVERSNDESRESKSPGESRRGD